MQRREGIHGWSLRESVGDQAVSHSGNSIVDGKIGTTIVRRSLPPLLRPRAPDSADSFSFRRQRRRRDETAQVIVRKYRTIDRRVEQTFWLRANVTRNLNWIGIPTYIYSVQYTARKIYNPRNFIHKIVLPLFSLCSQNIILLRSAFLMQ